MKKPSTLLFVLLSAHVSACQHISAPTTAQNNGAYLSGGFNDYAPVPRGQRNPILRSTEIPINETPALPGAQVPPQAARPATGSDIESLQVSQDFDYSSTQDIDLKLFVKNPNNTAYAQVPVTIFSPENNEVLAQGLSNTEGYLEKQFRVPAHYTKVLVQVSAMGIPNNIILPLQSSRIEAHFGPETHISYGGL